MLYLKQVWQGRNNPKGTGLAAVRARDGKRKACMQEKGLSVITGLFKPQVYKYFGLYWPLDLDRAEHLLSVPLHSRCDGLEPTLIKEGNQ